MQTKNARSDTEARESSRFTLLICRFRRNWHLDSTGCRGFIGPFPPPLLIRDYEIFLLYCISVSAVVKRKRQISRNFRRPPAARRPAPPPLSPKAIKNRCRLWRFHKKCVFSLLGVDFFCRWWYLYKSGNLHRFVFVRLPVNGHRKNRLHFSQLPIEKSFLICLQ